MIYLSGAGPQNAAGDFVLGKLGRDLDVYAPLLRFRQLCSLALSLPFPPPQADVRAPWPCREAGYDAARQCAINHLNTLKGALGSLDKVERLVKTLGMCNGTGDFGDSPAVINGYSELIKEVFGHEKGTGARSAVTMGSLPNNMAVEVEAIFQLVRPAKTARGHFSRHADVRSLLPTEV